MSSDRLNKHKNLLLGLSDCKIAVRNGIINNSDKDFIKAICECILNVMNGNVKLNTETHRLLKPFKLTFKKLLNRKNDIERKKHIIIQKGGFLQFLIPAVISGIASIASALISNRKSDSPKEEQE
jgi:hypothetical protein